MTRPSARGIRLEFSDGHAPATSLAAVNRALRAVGSRLWPLDLGAEAGEIRRLIAQPDPTGAEAERLLAHRLLPRERLLATIEAAGRTPHVAGGGALATEVTTHGYAYPQLYVVRAGVDYRRFDRLHVNAAADGTGVDEVLQMLCGAGVVIHQRAPDGTLLTLRLDCPSDDAGWLATYDGGNPHIGSLSGAAPGTKLVVQAIGPPRWEMTYEDDGERQ